MTRQQSCLQIFSKTPVKGQVKTRLIPAIGTDQALSIYLELLEMTIELAESCDVDCLQLWCYPDIDSSYFKNCQQGERLKLYAQQGENLGVRMQYAMTQGLAHHNKVVLIGSDCPALSKYIINEALIKLDTNDLVFGPAKDGGYYLLGMRNEVQAIFTGVDWGTASVLEQTLNHVHALGIDYELLEVLSDLDTREDLQYFQNLGFFRKYR